MLASLGCCKDFAHLSVPGTQSTPDTQQVLLEKAGAPDRPCPVTLVSSSIPVTQGGQSPYAVILLSSCIVPSWIYKDKEIQ